MTMIERPCPVCGAWPMFEPYVQSGDGNHDRFPRVVCACGAEAHLMPGDFERAEARVPEDRRYHGKTAFWSEEFCDALEDIVIERWNAAASDWDASAPEAARSGSAPTLPCDTSATYTDASATVSDTPATCDRAALLALADAVRRMGARYEEHGELALGFTFRAISERMREACGVSGDGR